MGAVFEGDVLAFDPAPLAEALAERFEERRRFGRTEPQKADSRRLPRLRLRGERRGEDPRPRAGEERATVHPSIPSSPRLSTDGGIVRPRALAVLRLMTSSNFV